MDNNGGMPKCLVPFALALLAAGAASPTLADGAPPLVVQTRTLKLPEPAAGAQMSPDVPEDGAIKMPYAMGGAAGVARRINRAVWSEMLDGVPVPAAPGQTFTLPPGQETQGTRSLDYTATFIPPVAPRVLSLALNGESCGAYCEDFAHTRAFDLRDGRRLSLGDLLTVDGFAEVGRRVDAARRDAYRKQVRLLERTLEAAARRRQKDPDDDTDDRLAMNQDCLESVDSEPSTPWWLLDVEFALDGHGGMTVTRDRCSNHAGRALDDVGQVTTAIPASELQRLLTPYGLAVVQQRGDAPAPPNRFDGRELHGRVGGAAITMKLDPLREGVDTPGWYAYDKYRTPIRLSVRQQGGDVVATEQGAGHGRFELTIGGGTLAGTWADQKHDKALPAIVQ